MYLNAIERTGGDFSGEDSYLQDIPAIKGLSLLELRQPVTFLVGENGSGKSTLLEAVALALGFNPEGGSRNFAFSTRDTHSGLHNYLRLHRGPYRPKDGFFLRAESFYNVSSEVDRLANYQPGTASTKATAESPYTTSPTGRASSAWCTTGFGARASTCWTSPKRPFPPPGS